VLLAEPPVDLDADEVPWARHTSTWLKRVTNWALDLLAEESDPYLAARYETGSRYGEQFAGLPPYHEEAANERRNRALKRMLLSGVLWGANWVQPAAAWLRANVKVNTPAARRLFKRGAKTTGGLAGAAAVAALIAYFLQHKAGPAPTGVLQGSPLSPLLANIYLHTFDCLMLRRRHHLVRYADDWLILCASQSTAEKAYNDAVIALARLDLKINREKTHIRSPDEPFNWLGIAVK